MQKNMPPQMNMFPGMCNLRNALEKNGASQRELDRFFAQLKPELDCLSKEYLASVSKRNAGAGIPPKITCDATVNLWLALRETNRKPFSRVISPFVDIRTGEPTEFGKVVIMDPDMAEKINSPSSKLVDIMSRLMGYTFEDVSRCSYEAFDYLRSGVAVGQPLLWLPLGNSLFLTRLAEFLRNSTQNVIVLNLGAGPGALEKLIKDKLSDFAGRLEVISVEMDGACLGSLKKINADAPYKWEIIEGNFAESEMKKRIVAKLSGQSAIFCVAGYSLHHLSQENQLETIKWLERIPNPKRHIQVHGVSGGENGGGQSPVNRIFFNFMAYYHLIAIQPNSFFAQNGFLKMPSGEARRLVADYPEMIVDGTTQENAETMLNNGSSAVFTIERLK